MCLCCSLNYATPIFVNFCSFCLWSVELCEGGLLHPDISLKVTHYFGNLQANFVFFFVSFLETSQISCSPLLGSKPNQTSTIFLLFFSKQQNMIHNIKLKRLQTVKKTKIKHSTHSTHPKMSLSSVSFSFLFFLNHQFNFFANKPSAWPACEKYIQADISPKLQLNGLNSAEQIAVLW